MKKYIYLIILIMNLMVANAQSISNGGFENWTGGKPNSWGTYGVIDPLINALYTKETNHTEGGFSIGLTTDTLTIPIISPSTILLNPSLYYGTVTFSGTSGLNIYGTPFTFRPDTIKFDFNFTPVGTDTIIIANYFTKASSLIAGFGPGGNSTFYSIGTGGNWESVAIPITYLNSNNPDSVIIIIQSGYQAPKIGSKLLLDNFRYVYKTSTGIYEEFIGSSSVKSYPSPATESITIEVEDGIENSSIEVFDINGNKVLVQDLDNKINNLDLKQYSNGYYNYRVIKDHKMYSGNFIISK